MRQILCMHYIFFFNFIMCTYIYIYIKSVIVIVVVSEVGSLRSASFSFFFKILFVLDQTTLRPKAKFVSGRVTQNEV